MKKIFLISVFLGLAISYGFSQTYYYKTVADIDADGVRSKPPSTIKGMYLTFINNNSICYESDKDGYRIKSRVYEAKNHQFQKTQNGTHVYYWGENQPYLGKVESFYYFSSDFSKLITYYSSYLGTTIKREYIRTNDTQDDNDDDIPTF